MKTILAAAAASLLLQFSPIAAQAATLVANISIGKQMMTVSENGFVKYRWKVSTARNGYVTPTGSWSAKWLSRDHRSRKYDNAPMPFAVFFNGGYAVHATFDLKRLGRLSLAWLRSPASRQCRPVLLAGAASHFANTRVVITR